MRTISAAVIGLLFNSLLNGEAFLISSWKRGTYGGLLLYTNRDNSGRSSKMPRGVKKRIYHQELCSMRQALHLAEEMGAMLLG